MSVQVRSLDHRRRIMGGATYAAKVLATAPIAYWQLNETAGATAACSVNPGNQDGTAIGVTWANDNGGPFGTPAPYFDGTNDYINNETAVLKSAFSGATGTAAVWARVANAGIWTDATIRKTLQVWGDNNNSYSAGGRVAISNRMQAAMEAGGGGVSINRDGLSTLDWFHVAATWSDQDNDDEAIFYYNGQAVAPASSALGAWDTDLTRVLIGAYTTVPSLTWHGWLAHAVLWDRVLAPTEVAAIAAA